jgi:hypothetical protein
MPAPFDYAGAAREAKAKAKAKAKAPASKRAPGEAQTLVLAALKALRRDSRSKLGYTPAQIGTLTGLNSSSQVCTTLRGLIANGLVVKLGAGHYNLA